MSSAEDLQSAKTMCVKLSQREVDLELRSSISQETDVKVTGRFKKLAPFLDESGIWRVGLRMLHYAPFTSDKKPPIFLPNSSRYTRLLMEHAHGQKHSGVEDTVSRFRMNGFWTVQAGKLAKSVKSKCIICRYLDRNALSQSMGSCAAN